MKKPRKPKARRAVAQRPAAAPPASRRPLPRNQAQAFRPAKPAQPPRRRPAAAAALASRSDARETLTLLLAPFFIMAFALAMSQTLRPGVRVGGLASPAPVEAVRTARVGDPLAHAPALALPRQAPMVPAPLAEDALARMARLELPRRAPAVELPEVLVTTRLALPVAPPAIEPPELRLAAPFMLLPALPPAIPIPEIALLEPALRLPAGAPLIPAPPPMRAPEPVAAAPALPALEPSGLAPGPLVLSNRPRTELCTAPPGMGRHVYPAPAAGDAAMSTEEFGRLVSAAAIAQTQELVIYSSAYRRMAFPMGDVSPQFGVCTDVVVRAYRSAGIDLQELVHRARVGGGDPNIDHRRTDVLRRFFAAHGQSLPVTSFPEDYLPGDIVTYKRPQNRRVNVHVAVVTDRIAPSGRPMIVHNRGWGPQLEDGLFVDEITGHYRFAPQRAAPVLEAGRPTLKRPTPPPLSRALVKASLVPPLPGGTQVGRAEPKAGAR